MPGVKSIPIVIVRTLALFLAVFTFIFSGSGCFTNPAPSPGDPVEKEITIPMGSSTAYIAEMLEDEGLIRSAYAFRILSRQKGYDGLLKAGYYQLSSDMTMEEILLELQKGIIRREGVRFTIPEGYTVEEMGARFEELGFAEKDAFINACQSYEADEADFLRNIFSVMPEQVNYSLEGYLFPDTYEVDPEISAEDIVKLMSARFLAVFNDEYRLRAEEMGLDVHQIVTIASIVEKEAVIDEERPLIAAVFHNRLNSGTMPYMQSCATVQYVLGEPKPVLTYRDLEVESPYNTYLHPGLPPGPIAAPGLLALEAALYPADADYLFFVAREDGSGGHYFSRTLQEHNRYKSIAQQNRR